MAVTSVPVADPAIPAAAPAFDAKAFRDEIMGSINQTLNGFAKSMKTDIEKLIKPPAADPVVDPAADPVDPPKDVKTVADLNTIVKQLNAKLTAQGDQLTNETKLRIEKENQLLEKDRLSQVRKAMETIDWASPKARQQFEDAILPKVKRDEAGSLIVETDKGVMSYDVFIQAEALDSPHFLAPQGQGGAGASSGKKPGASPRINILEMTTEQIMALPKETRAATFAENLRIASSGQ